MRIKIWNVKIRNKSKEEPSNKKESFANSLDKIRFIFFYYAYKYKPNEKTMNQWKAALHSSKIHSTDVIVVGLGSVGSFAIDYLAQNGISTIGIERFSRLHTRGSNHGKSRVYRHAYYEHPDYVPLLLDSTKRFKELEKEMDIPIMNTCGVLILSENDTNKRQPSSYESIVDLAYKSALEYSIPVEMLNKDEIRHKFPQFNITENTKGLWEPGAGFIRPENSILAALARAEKNGATLLHHTKLCSFMESDNKNLNNNRNSNPYNVEVKVNTSDSENEDDIILRSKSLIITSGAYIPELIPSLKPYLKVTRQRQAWFHPHDTEKAHPKHLPCWFVDRGYGMPPYVGIPSDPDLNEISKKWSNFTSIAPPTTTTSSPLFKVAIHGGGEEVDPETYSKAFNKQDDDDLKKVAQEALPNLPGTYSHGSACLYTETPDGHFIVDQIPNQKHSWVVAGLSGHGFKLAPALGKIISDMALYGKTDLPAEFLRLSRLDK